MKRYLLILLAGVILLPSVYAINIRYDQPIKIYSNASWGPNNGYTFLQHIAPTWGNEIYANQQMNAMGACLNRIDVRRDKWWDNATQSWLNASGAFLQIGNASAVKEEVKFNVVNRSCDVVIVDNEMPKAFGTTNTTICNANDTRCSPFNATLDAQNRYNLMEFLSPGGIYDDHIWYEVRNEINYPAFFAPNIGETSVADVETRSRLAWEQVNATCVQNFSISRPNLKCGINYVHYWEKDIHNQYLRSYLGNFSQNGRLRQNMFVGVHLYITDTFITQAKFTNSTNNYTVNGYYGMVSVLNDITRTCAQVLGNATYCNNSLPILNSEYAWGQQGETEQIKTMNLTYTSLAYEKELWMMRYGSHATTVNLTSIWYQGPGTTCYLADDQYPLYWPMWRIGLFCTTPPGQNIGTVNWTTFNVTKRWADYVKDGGMIFNVTQTKDIYGYAQNNTNGSWILFLTNDNATNVRSEPVVFFPPSNIRINNMIDVDNGTVYTVTSNTTTVSLSINDTRRYFLGVQYQSVGGAGGPDGGQSCDELVGVYRPIRCPFGLACFSYINQSCTLSYQRPSSLRCTTAGVCS